ncbi:hypothetical protein CRES_2031 [Corynebacterium resistens DSM 45100]|uniref:DUF4177 domain-containing protein n=2 Tax=Corynebacterium resistens TaxID=258224 RepID=F8DXP7_CORRG|nr:hypothetical protein CRES_2031 [Corynebacterium resistens DSM 45100]
MFHGMDSSKTPGQAKMSGRFVILAGMTKWEYATVPLLTHATKQILDNWGQDGWELVSVLPGPTGEQHVAYLKRELD